jgi:hypothetical protein
MLGQRESVVTITAVALQLSLLTPPFETLENRLILTRRIKMKNQVKSKREATEKKKEVLDSNGKLKRKDYERELARLHVDLVKLQE